MCDPNLIFILHFKYLYNLSTDCMAHSQTGIGAEKRSAEGNRRLFQPTHRGLQAREIPACEGTSGKSCQCPTVR